MQEKIYTVHNVRLTSLYIARQKNPLNVVLLPGGPGMGAEYLKKLAHLMPPICSTWLVDLPGNGNHRVDQNIDYEMWPDYLEDIFAHLSNVVLVGHSYGGILILLNPKLDALAKGLMIISSRPKEISAADKLNYKANTEFSELMKAYNFNPSDHLLKAAIIAATDLYFTKEHLEEGATLLKETSYAHEAYHLRSLPLYKNYQAQFVPTCPTLILSGDVDWVCPLKYFQSDERFKRDHIDMVEIHGANHFPWIDNPQDTLTALSHWIYKIQFVLDKPFSK